MTHIGVIGGGASGMMAAIIAARHAKVTILEHTDQIGKKLLSTGNGKCNFTNLNISEDDYYGNHPSFVKKALSRFGPRDMVRLLEEEGFLTIEKRGGYLYPYSGQATTIRDFLKRKIEQLKIQVEYGVRITSIQKIQDGFRVICDQKSYTFDKVILAAGGLAAPFTGSDGSLFRVISTFQLKTVKMYPALAPLFVNDSEITLLAGVRTNGMAKLTIDGQPVISETGEVQFTKDAVSGIPVFQLCHYASGAFAQKKDVKIWIDFLPQMSYEQTLDYLHKLRTKHGRISIEHILAGLVHQKIALAILKRLKISQKLFAKDVSDKQLKKINSCLHQFVFTMSKQADFLKAQVTCGGISIEEVDEDMMVKKVPGLYVVGEMLNIDGKCGGYNLQWAWTSGYIAGEHASFS